MKKLLELLALSLVILPMLNAAAFAVEQKPENKPQKKISENNKKNNSPSRPVAEFQTSMGNFKIELYSDLAPITVKNFTDLANKNFYDGVIFHRVIDGFMIQGGDPTGTGRGGPGYTIPDEFGEGLKHNAPGILSMANAGANTGGSQFFITLNKTPWLDGKHAIFGHVINGMEIVEAIGHSKTDARDKPIEPVIIKKIIIK